RVEGGKRVASRSKPRLHCWVCADAAADGPRDQRVGISGRGHRVRESPQEPSYERSGVRRVVHAMADVATYDVVDVRDEAAREHAAGARPEEDDRHRLLEALSDDEAGEVGQILDGAV